MRLRFHLGKGKHFRQWQVRSRRTVQYYAPDEVALVVKRATLCNRPVIAERINLRATTKTVCAWIECASVSPIDVPSDLSPDKRVYYDPHVAPHWRSAAGHNIDGSKFGTLIAYGRALYSLD